MTTALLGREHPAAVLRGEIGRAADSHGALVLVTGEAGIGKTTLVTDAAEEARRHGALVLSGTCWDSDSAPGYWPWVQVIRALRRGATAAEWLAAQDAAGGGLAVLLGESPGSEPSDSFRLYDAVTSALVAVSQRRPVLVVLDDLHWADTASVKLLEFAARHTWFERLLLVGTYRDVEVEAAEHPLRPLFMSLVAKATTVTLTGLDRAEVGALMRRTAGRQPDPDLVAEVHRRTGGNPFFVEQTARLWHSGGPVTGVAPGVRDALRRRLSLLPGPVVGLLTAAAVLGREFHRQVLAATVGSAPPAVDRLLDQAVSARLVVGRGAGRFSFTHDLVREALYDSLDDAELRRRHAAVVRALDTAPTLAGRVHPADVARHAYLAGDELEPARAVQRLLAAAGDASTRMAFEESVGHRRRALERVGGTDPRQRTVIALTLGQQLHHLGDREDAWRAFQQALGCAREVADPDLLARVALTLYQAGLSGDRGRLATELLVEAHGRLVGDADPRQPHRSVDRLARELTARVAVLARRGGDDEALAFILWAQHDVIWGLGSAAQRTALTEELIGVAQRTGDPETEHFASSLRWVALLEQGDPGYLDQFRSFVAMAEKDDLPRSLFSSLVDRSIIAGLLGRFTEAHTLLGRATEDFGDHNHTDFAFMNDHLHWALLQLQGRFDELAELERRLATGGHPFPHLLAGITAAQRGDADAALSHLARLTPGGEPLPRSFTPLGLRLRAQAAAVSGNPQLCAQARAALAPHSGQWLVSIYGCDISGPVDLWVAVVDAAERRWDPAVAGFIRAYRSADRLQSRPWSVEARTHLAGALLARGAEGDADRAEELLSQTRAEAAELGMRHIEARIRQQRVAVAAGHDPPGPVPGRRTAGTFRRDGAVWLVEFAGRAVHLPDAKGLGDLHLLLSRPGTDIPAVQLLSPDGGALVLAARRFGGDPVLDDVAKSRYQRRLRQLDDEIDRAVERDDDERAAGLDRERELLLDELRAAAGLAGRTRRLGDEAERARKTVTARIRDTLRKLDQHHPRLAEHLRAAVSTGATCRYQPQDEVSWRL